MYQALRGDNSSLFRTQGRVHGYRLFPLDRPVPGITVLDGGRSELHQLYEQLAELIGREDALEPGTATAQSIAELDARISAFEAREAQAEQAQFERNLPFPVNFGATMEKRLAELLATVRDPAADNAASNNG